MKSNNNQPVYAAIQPILFTDASPNKGPLKLRSNELFMYKFEVQELKQKKYDDTLDFK